jgi:electron transfer flavoprotein alpha subunit
MVGVLCLSRFDGETVPRSTRELLRVAQRLADGLQEPLLAGLLGSGQASLFPYGVETLYRGEHPLLQEYQADLYLSAFEQLAREAAPRILLLPGDSLGRDLASRLAFRLTAGIVTEIIEVDVERGSKLPRFIRQVYGGKARGVITPKTFPVVVTVKPRTFEPAEPRGGGQGKEITVELSLDPSRARSRLVKRIQEEATGVKLADARIVISGGRGLGGPEGFRPLEELAALLKGAVGASRAACDAGWVPASWQVGQTGQTVSPDLYIAVGISGATQHVAGISAAKAIVAINADPEAPIFKVATLGIVGDYRTILPPFIAKCRELVGG